jgi:hypothetical protein
VIIKEAKKILKYNDLTIEIQLKEAKKILKYNDLTIEIQLKEAKKILKYKDLTIEIQCMWNVKTKAIPVIIMSTGTACRQLTSVHYTASCKHGLVLLRMGEIIARNMLS